MTDRDLIHLLGQALQLYTRHDRQATAFSKKAHEAYTKYCQRHEDFGTDIEYRATGRTT